MSVEGLCAQGKVLKDLAKGCSIARVPDDDGVQHGRRLVRLALPWVTDEMFVPFVHHDCIHNQVIAVHNRVCGKVPLPTSEGLASMRVAAAKVVRLLPKTVPEDYYVMPMRYGGAKRTRYLNATDDVMAFAVVKGDSTIKMFVKTERLQPDQAKPNPDPRAIQFRNAKYCVELGRFLKPIEEHLYALSGVGAGVPPTRAIAKGLNQVERAELLVEKISHFDDPVVLSLDASRFDQHVDQSALRIEHSVYLACCWDEWFAKLLSWQLNNVCFTSRGMKYKVKGKRMSGDMNTALGNCLLMIIMMMAFLAWCKKWDVLDDGDDALLIVERRDLARVVGGAKKGFLEFGHELKVENVATVLERIVFCQSQMIEFSPGRYKFVRNPWKVMSCALTGVKYFGQVGARAKLLYSIGLCELILALGVPVLQEFGLAILRNCGVERGLELPPDGSLMSRVRREMRTLGMRTLERVDPQVVLPCARASFEVAFGMSPERQIEVEAKLRVWEFQLQGCIDLPAEWDVPRWVLDPTQSPEVYPL